MYEYVLAALLSFTCKYGVGEKPDVSVLPAKELNIDRVDSFMCVFTIRFCDCMSVGFTVIGFANEGLRAVFRVVFPLVLAYSRGVHPL